MNIRRLFRHGLTTASGVLLTASIACAAAQRFGPPPSIVVRYCSGCHGVNGISQLPYIPRLAGLRAAYIERKFARFRSASSSPVDEAFQRIVHIGTVKPLSGITPAADAHMVGVANAVSDGDLKAAAIWYAAQQSAPVRKIRQKSIESGRNLYINGRESQRLQACQFCHGPEAQGTETAPRLAGQNFAYVIDQLTHFRTLEKSASPMTEVARNLEGGQARAIAAYLQALPVR